MAFDISHTLLIIIDQKQNKTTIWDSFVISGAENRLSKSKKRIETLFSTFEGTIGSNFCFLLVIYDQCKNAL